MRPEPPTLPALVVGRVTHTRRTPRRHRLDHAHRQWLVDLDHLPVLPRPVRWLARFDAADHLDGGRLGGGIRGDLTRWLDARGVVLDPTDRVLMLAHARQFGHVFDPLTVFWVLDRGGELRPVVLEVHNTYSERHANLMPRTTTVAPASTRSSTCPRSTTPEEAMRSTSACHRRRSP